MASAGTWKILHHNRPEVPRLLAKLVISDNGYNIAVTDLTSVWRELLSHDQIVQRAETEGCSINPGDDPQQFRILSSKIEDAFSLAAGASITFDKPEDESGGLVLVATAPLPTPLPPFSWKICLKMAESTELTTAIVSPTLRLAYEQQRELRYLLDQLSRKDHVIGKLLDRMESANVHLDSVFPLPNIKFSKRIPQRDQFAKHVPGLANFQPGSETSRHDDAPSSDQLCSVLEKVPDGGSVLATPRLGWWLTVNNTSSQSNASLKPEYSVDLDGDETDDDEFQTQELPEHLKEKTKVTVSPPSRSSNKSMPLTHHVVDEDAETTEGEESAPPSPRPQQVPTPSPPPTTSSQIQPSTRRLGKIGGPRVQNHVAIEESRETTKSISPTANKYIASSLTPPVTESTPPVSAVPVKRKLGTLGGRRASSQAPSQHPQEPSPSMLPIVQEKGPLQSFPVTYENTLSQVNASSSATATGRSRLDRYEYRDERPVQPRETSEERANKRREKLKKELELKQAPVKKKRKF